MAAVPTQPIINSRDDRAAIMDARVRRLSNVAMAAFARLYHSAGVAPSRNPPARVGWNPTLCTRLELKIDGWAILFTGETSIILKGILLFPREREHESDDAESGDADDDRNDRDRGRSRQRRDRHRILWSRDARSRWSVQGSALSKNGTEHVGVREEIFATSPLGPEHGGLLESWRVWGEGLTLPYLSNSTLKT